MNKFQKLLLGVIGSAILFVCGFYAYANISPQSQGTGGTATSTVFSQNSLIIQGANSYAAIAPGSTGSVLMMLSGVPTYTATTSLGLQPAGIYVNSVSGSGNIQSSGGTTPTISFTGVLPAANGGIGTTTLGNLTVGTNLSVTGGQKVLIGTSTSISLGAAVVTGVATNTTGSIFNAAISANTLTISIPNASAASTGTLTSNDWSTFNGKQAALVSGTNIKTINGNTLLGSGNLAISGGSGGVATTSPFTSGQVPYATSTLALTDSPISIQGSNVGIGTTTPSFPLDVQGSIDTWGNYNYDGQNFITASSGLGNLYMGLQTGNASNTGTHDTIIGYQSGFSITAPSNAAPAQNDTIIGYKACPNLTTARETTCIGAQAGQAYIGNGVGIEDGLSMFIGSLAGQNFPGTGVNDTDNLFIGQKSGQDLVSGGLNIFLGNHSGISLATSTDSIFIGHAAAGTTTVASTGLNDIVIGPFAMYNPTGLNQSDVVIGYESAYNQVSATGNTMIGTYSGFNNSTGTRLTDLGMQSGYGSATATDNTMLGYNAGILTTASYNTLVGSTQAALLTSGKGNTLLGYNDGSLMTIGAYNVLIGWEAGDAITTGVNNTIIGELSNVKSGGDSNETVIGGGATGNGTNTLTLGTSAQTVDVPGLLNIGTSTNSALLTLQGSTSSASILNITASSGVSDLYINGAGNVGIGTTSPANLLDVNGNADVQGQFAVGTTTLNSTYQLTIQGIKTYPLVIQNSTGVNKWYIDQSGNTVQSGTLQISTITAVGAGNSSFSGNVGIGTTSPSEKLEVSQALTSGSGVFTKVIDTTYGSNVKIGAYYVPADQSYAGIWFNQTTPNATNYAMLANGGGGGTLFNSPSGQSTQFRIANATYMTIASTGNVGIGTTTPTATLALQGAAGQSRLLFNITSSSGASLLTVTSAPDTSFSVMASSTAGVNDYYFKANKVGISSSSTPPTLSSCGTSPSVSGSNPGMVVTVGSVAATACTITFNPPFTNSPSCTVTNRSSSIVNAMTYTVSNTAVTVSQTGLTGDVLDIHCIGIGEP